MFLHQEPSDLVLYNHGQRLGSFQIQPHVDQQRRNADGNPIRLVTVHGGFSVDAPLAQRQNVVLHGILELDAQNNAQRLEISATLHEPKRSTPGWAATLDGQPRDDRWHCVLRAGNAVLLDKDGTFSELLDVPELRSLGIDLAGWSHAQPQQVSRVAVTAHRDKLKVNGDEIDAYVASLKDASGLETTISMNQLGQVLTVKTFTDIELLDAALAP